MVKLHKFIDLSWTDRFYLARVAILVGLIRVGLILLPFKTLKRAIDRTSGRRLGKDSEVSTEFVDRVVWAVRAVARNTLGDKPCLVQALATKWLLGRAGSDSTLRIGVRKGAGEELLAHAWLIHDGDIVIGGRSSTNKYVSFDSPSQQ